MLALVAFVVAAPLLVVVSDPASPAVFDAASEAIAGRIEVVSFSPAPGPACAADPSCVTAGVVSALGRGDAVLWLQPGADGTSVVVARTPDAAIVVSEVVSVAPDSSADAIGSAVVAAVRRVAGHAPAALARLADTSPTGSAAAPVAVAATAPDNTLWWVGGGIGAAAVVGLVAVGAYGLARADRQSRSAQGPSADSGVSDAVIAVCDLMLIPFNAVFSICTAGATTANLCGDAIAGCAGAGPTPPVGGDRPPGGGDPSPRDTGGGCDLGSSCIGSACDIGSCGTGGTSCAAPGISIFRSAANSGGPAEDAAGATNVMAY